MDLIIVESPTKAKTLGRFLGKDYQILASMGHVRDLPGKSLGVDIAHDFAPLYEVSAKKKEKVAELQKAAEKAKEVILATDPDREGEAISWHIAQLLAVSSKQLAVRRIAFHEITETAIKEALNNPRTIDMNLVDAQQARRILDRLVGYKLSPILWRKVRRGLSAGRVQSVAVRLIVEREREIKAFVPLEYWEVVAKFDEGFEAKLAKIEIKNKNEADKIVESLKVAEFKVEKVETKEVRKYPYPPFTTSTMQQAASVLFGWSAKRTMQIAQNLYEEGLITYHRTDSTNMATEAVEAVRNYIKSNYGNNYVPAEPRFYRVRSRVAQEAHEAIRPTDVQGLAVSGERLERDQKKLYELIWKRFVACQMAEAIYEQTGVDIAVSSKQLAVSYAFRANGNRVIFDGWQKLYEQLAVSGEQIELPKLTVGEILKLLELVPSQHFTEGPARYTEAALIKILEEYGIGRPSTYAPIISTIQERQYVERSDKKFVPTALGFAVNDFLMANFGNVLDYQFTAHMEEDLDEIANGKKKWVPVLREFYDPFSQQLTKVGDTAQRVKIETETTDEFCPDCQSPLIVRIGKFGKFAACSKFPECKFTKSLVVKANIKCPKCGGEVIVKKTKSKKSFFGCSNYPKCDFASWTKPKLEISG